MVQLEDIEGERLDVVVTLTVEETEKEILLLRVSDALIETLCDIEEEFENVSE